jgi:hypothetical protein
MSRNVGAPATRKNFAPTVENEKTLNDGDAPGLTVPIQGSGSG